MKNLHTFLVLTSILFSIQSFSQDYNFDFENIENNRPKEWFYRTQEGFEISIDSKVKHSKNHSVSIENICANEESFQPIEYRIPANFKGEKIKLIGYIKTENVSQGFAGLWIRVDPYLGLNNMYNRDNGITGTTDWKKYELELELKDRAESIAFGALLSGTGKCWIDNLELTIDGTPVKLIKKTINNTPKKVIKDWFYYRTLSMRSYYTKDYDNSLKFTNTAIELAKKDNLKEDLMFLHEHKAYIYSYKDDLVNVLDAYNNALKLSIELNNLDSKLKYLTYLANFYQISENFSEAIEIIKKIILELELLKKNNKYYDNLTSNPSLSKQYNTLTDIYIYLKNSIEAEKYNILMFSNLKEHKGVTFDVYHREYYIHKGEISFLNKDYATAKKLFLKGYNYPLEVDRRVFQKKYNLGRIAFEEGEYDKAITLLEEEEYNKYEDTHNDYYLYLARAYKKLNKLNKANDYFEKHINSISILKKEKGTIALKLREREIDKARAEFENLKTQKEESESYFFYGITSLLLLVVFGLLYIVKNKRKNKQKFKALIAKLNQKENVYTDTNNVIKPTKSTIDLTEETTKKILRGLKRLEENQYYLNTDCNTINVSKKIKTNTSYLSKVISYHYQSNFNAYINNLRINYAVSRLKNDTVFRAYSIQSISEEIGYKSPDSFTKYFKKHTGLLPSYYIKQLNSNN